MPRSARLHPSRKSEVLKALERHGFLSQGDFAAHLEVALSTINNFINSKPVSVAKFEEICEVLDLDKRVMTQSVEEALNFKSQVDKSNSRFISVISYDQYWVGRSELIQKLSDQLKGSCRFLFILGLTGIGKTALAERIILEVAHTFALTQGHHFKRVNFEALGDAKDFVAIASQWLESWKISLPLEQRKPEQLLWQVTQYLQHNTVILFFDSFENLLTGNEENGWGNLVDKGWERFFLSLLSVPFCQSRLVFTSQDLPVSLVEQRYAQFWHCQVLTGLDESEQTALFEATGLDISLPDQKSILLRLGKAYQGHPLVLRVIIGEIEESFGGSVLAYWEEIKGKIEAVELAIAAAEDEAKRVMGGQDNWKLHKLTRKVRLEVNKQRLTSVFERLATQSPDAYYLICAASVYRVPVQVQGWLLQLAGMIQRLEHQSCGEERQEMALEGLCYRFLVEESINENNQRVVGLHHLIRSVALEHYQRLIAQLKQGSKIA